MKTRNGIYYDLTLSSYIYKLRDTGLTFVFSSDLHLTKFEEQYKKHRNDFNLKLKSRFRLNVNFTTFADIVLYKKIETRGFLILIEGGQKLCQENLKLVGERATPKS
jgi:hypothetical protein